VNDYTALASSYDGLMTDGDYRRRTAWLTAEIRRYVPGASRILDLGCGTGTVACLLAEAGFDVIAADASEEMLTQAAGKADALQGRRPMFVLQPMERLRLPEPVDAVVSTLDSLNYLTTRRALRRTFRNVWNCLKPGGVFLFDVNTPYKFLRMDGGMYTDETEDSFCVWRTFYSPGTAICTYQVDLFRRRGGLWERDYEEHRERAWSGEELEGFLREAGFTGLRRTGDLSRRPPAETEYRWNYRCVKTKG